MPANFYGPQTTPNGPVLAAGQGHARSGGGAFGHMALRMGFPGADAPRASAPSDVRITEAYS